jgi:hypothetical protein
LPLDPNLIAGDLSTTIIPLGGSMPSDGAEPGIEEVSNGKEPARFRAFCAEVLRADTLMTIKTLVAWAGLSQRQASRIIVNLREYGLLRREGSDRYGRWVVLKQARHRRQSCPATVHSPQTPGRYLQPIRSDPRGIRTESPVGLPTSQARLSETIE